MKALVLGACWEAIGSFMPRRMTACPLFPLLGDVGGDEDFAGGAQLTTAHRRAMAAQAWCPYWGTTLMGSWQEKKSGEGKGAHWRVRKSSNRSHELNLTSYAWVLDGRQNEAQSERLIARKYDAYSGEGNGTPLQYSCWKAAVHRVTEGRTRLSDFTFTHWRRKWQPTPVFLPGESQGRGSLVGCRLWGRTESDMIEVT